MKFLMTLIIGVLALSVSAASAVVQPIEEPPMSYKGAPYLLWNMARLNDTILYCEIVEETVMPVQHIYEQHHIKVRVLDTIKGTPLPDEYLIYTVVYEVGRNKQTKHPGSYPASGQTLIGFNRGKLAADSRTGLRYAGDLTFSRLNPTALRYLPMVKKDYPELFD